MDRYQYKGHPAHLKAACDALGVNPDDVHTRARTLLGALDSLAGQVADAQPEHRAGIFGALSSIRDTYAVMHATAERVLAEIRDQFGLTDAAPKIVPHEAVDAFEALLAERDEFARRIAALGSELAATKAEAKADEPRKGK